MRVCRLCAGPMPEIVRDDALYCSTSCKLKAQRRRKKGRACQASEDRPRVFEPNAPFGNAEQLSFAFMGPGVAPVSPTAEPMNSDARATPPAPLPPETPKPRSWFGELINRLTGGASDNRPRQRSKSRGLDIV